MDGELLARMGLTLSLLLAVPATMLWTVRRLGVRLPGQSIEAARLKVVARTAVDAKHVLLLIRRDAQEQLLLLSPAGPTVLEGAIRLSREDRAEQRRQAREQAERTAAAAAAMAAAQQRAQRLASLISDGLVALRERIRAASAPSFVALVEKPREAPTSRKARSTEIRHAPAGRPRRARPSARSA